MVLPLLAKELPRIDLFVYDVPHEDRDARTEFARLDPLVRERGVVIVVHGIGGGRCDAQRRWARDRRTPTFGRTGLGLYGLRMGRAAARR